MKIPAEPGEAIDALATSVIGAAIEVHKHLGPGYLESVYEEALSVELTMRGIPYERQYPVPVRYKGTDIGSTRLDLLIDRKLIVELKAVESMLPIHKSQVISYLKAMSLPLGILITFNVRMLRDGVHRIIRSS